MHPETFNAMMFEIFTKIRDMSTKKQDEYQENTDRLKHFRKKAHLRRRSVPQAIWDCADKHIISITDMVDSGDDFPLSLWDEKIIDNMVYLLLLRAAILETLAIKGKESGESQQLWVNNE
jgi:hypothetical protein